MLFFRIIVGFHRFCFQVLFFGKPGNNLRKLAGNPDILVVNNIIAASPAWTAKRHLPWSDF